MTEGNPDAPPLLTASGHLPGLPGTRDEVRPLGFGTVSGNLRRREGRTHVPAMAGFG